MFIYISLLRGINVSGQKKIKMGDLRGMYESLGLSHVKTYVQSGNVVFTSDAAGPDLAASIHAAIQRTFDYDVEVIVHSVERWRAILNGNPFTFAQGLIQGKEPQHLYFTFLASTPDSIEVAPINAGSEQYHIIGDMVYLYCPDGYGRSKLNNNFWERKLKVAATTRNWNSVYQVLALADSISPDN